MITKEGNIEGVNLYEFKAFTDIRGSLKLIYKFNELNSSIQSQISSNISQVFITNSIKDVIRGMHLQLYPKANAKIISVLLGEIKDVLLDLRPDSSSFLNVMNFNLSSNKDECLFVPKGVAHGYKVISDNATVLYLQDLEYDSALEYSIRFNSIGFDWKLNNPILSDRDKNAIGLSEFLTKGLE